MIEMTSTHARQHFGEFLDRGSQEIIIVKRQNRKVGAFIPMSELAKLRKWKAEELQRHAHNLSQEAAEHGMTEEILNSILSEVNPS